jgi:hypothetical protein
MPRDMKSFILSYDSATLVKTPATRPSFSDSGTVSKPKCVLFVCCWVELVESGATARDRVFENERIECLAHDNRAVRAQMRMADLEVAIVLLCGLRGAELRVMGKLVGLVR